MTAVSMEAGKGETEVQPCKIVTLYVKSSNIT